MSRSTENSNFAIRTNNLEGRFKDKGVDKNIGDVRGGKNNQTIEFTEKVWKNI